MGDETVPVVEVDPAAERIVRAGAICAFLVVLGYLTTFPLYAWVGTPPSGNIEAQLAYFGEHASGWWIIASLMVATDLLLVPLFLALYQALKGLGRDLMLLALACIGLFVATDLAITWTAHSVLITGGTEYAAASSIGAKAALAAGAAYASAVLASPIAGVCAIVLPSLGILFTGLVMLRGVFGRPTAYLALVAGLTAVAFMGSYIVEAMSPLRILNALLVMIWYALAGIRLYALGRHTVR